MLFFCLKYLDRVSKMGRDLRGHLILFIFQIQNPRLTKGNDFPHILSVDFSISDPASFIPTLVLHMLWVSQEWLCLETPLPKIIATLC